MKYLDEIAKGLKKIANGELDYRIEEKGKDEFRNLATNINYMSEEIKKKWNRKKCRKNKGRPYN